MESLTESVRNAVHLDWDPIGIGKEAADLGEYDHYVPALCTLLERGASKQVLFDTLWRIETEYIGLRGNRSATEKFAEKLAAIAASR